MKKAELMSQPLYYVFVMIVIAMVLYFGFTVITKLGETKEKANFIQFKTDFQSSVSNIYSLNPGSKNSYSLLLPKDAKQVCFKKFADYSKISSDSKYFQSFDVNNLVSNQNSYCIDIKNQKISFTLENKIFNGKTLVEIS